MFLLLENLACVTQLLEFIEDITLAIDNCKEVDVI